MKGMSSSDEDQPLVERAKRAAAVLNLEDSDDDSVPSWLANHKSPAPGAGLPSDSSDSSDVEEVAQEPARAPAEEQQEPVDEAQPSQQPGKQQQQQQPQRPRQQGPPQGGTPQAARPDASGAAAAPEPVGPGASQLDASQPVASQPATAQKKVSGHHLAPVNQLPVVLPDKLPQMKVLVELESVEGGATDLAGDAGAVGRVLVTGPPGDQQLQIDLKGVLYSATIVPCPVTLAVVNVGQSEAKVESLFSEFLQLREDKRFSCHDTGALDSLLAEDDPEGHYMVDGAGGASGAPEGEGGAAKKGRKRAGDGKAGGKGGAGGKAKAGAKGAVGGALRTTGGGVKKPRAVGAGKSGKAGAGKAKPKSKPKAAGAAAAAAAKAKKPKAAAAKKK